MPHLVEPNAWVSLRLPNEVTRALQVIPNTTISLGKYGSFPSNLIIERPYHITYEIQDKRDGETYCRLRAVPGTELNADKLADLSAGMLNGDNEAETDLEGEGEGEGEVVIKPADGEELTLVEEESGRVVARSTGEAIDESARQTLTTEEIEELKRHGASAGKALVAKLMLSHTAIDQKTAYSLAKYKLLKEKKYMRRFTVLPLDVAQLAHWMLLDRDAGKVMEMRQEMIGLLGCWADVHVGGRWLAVDDTGGLLVAALAERMGILHRPEGEGAGAAEGEEYGEAERDNNNNKNSRKRPHRDDLEEHYAADNTITVVHSNSQPSLALLRYYGYDACDPAPAAPHHPLFTRLLPVSWLQLVDPEADPAYAEAPPSAEAEELLTWKSNRRANYHRKRRRWARIRQVVDSARAGGFSGLAVASSMDPVSIVRHALPLLAGGAPVAIYSPSIEPLARLADCFSIGRRGAWAAGVPAEAEGRTAAELERWEGSAEFPINPALLIGATVQTSRATRWQVLPGRTHPFMTEKGGATGYLFTGWRAVPAEGRVAARGKFHHKRR